MLFCLLACGSSAQRVPVAALDYTQIDSPTGWSLRVYGNGSGSIRHEQLPAYHLHYPCFTFSAMHLRPRPNACGRAALPCVRLTTYAALQDSASVCDCADAEWAENTIALAIEKMDEAMEAGSNQRSCRMLRRRWLVEN